MDWDARPRMWESYSLSVEGESHKRYSIPCQDASASGILGKGHWAYAIVADGHGSARHFRSDRGPRMAVDVLRDAFQTAVDGLSGAQTGGLTPKVWSEWAAGSVVARWRSQVWSDLLDDPPDVQMSTLAEAGLGRFLEEVVVRGGHAQQASLVLQMEAFQRFAARHSPCPDEPLPLPSDAAWDAAHFGNWQASAYGTTLLGVLVGPGGMFILRQGDGAMIEVRGDHAKYLVPPPPEAIGNATPSMCDDDAVHEILAATMPVPKTDSLSGLLLTTDGIPNSYSTLDGFFAFCTDVAASGLSEPGLEDKLAEWLPQISAKGSGDDVSIALLLDRSAAAPKRDPAVSSEQGDPASEPQLIESATADYPPKIPDTEEPC